MTDIKSEAKGAIADVEFILNTIDKGSRNPKDLRTEMGLLLVLFTVCTVFFVFEIVSNDVLTRSLEYMADSRGDQIVGLSQIFIALAAIATALYLMAWRRAREAQASVQKLINRSLKDLSFRSVLPDLALKFGLFVLIFYIRRPDLMPVLCTAFTADYILQGRFFRMPAWASIIAGCGTYAVAAYLAYQKITLFTVPLGIFAVASIVSVIWLQTRISESR